MKKFFTIDDLIVGKCYTRDDDAEYLILYKAKNFFIALVYSFNHYVGNINIYNEDWLNETWNNLRLKDNKEYNITDFIDDFKYIDDNTIKLEYD